LKIGVAMSGGVDSSTVLALLKEQGNETVGLTLKILPCEISRAENGAVAVVQVEPSGQRCCSVQDIADARDTAVKFGAPHSVVEGLDVFRANVVEGFLDGYARGLTPNPCVECNPHAKLPLLLKRALEMGCEKMATGHYARVAFNETTGRWNLLKAFDGAKDQTYYLYKLPQRMLAHLVFPLGGITKPEVRGKARAFGIAAAEKPESMEICFVTHGTYRDFVRQHRPEAFKPGEIQDLDGRVLGRHDGVANYTIGQRKGLDLSGGPWFVLSLDPDSARVVVGRDEDTLCPEFTVGDVLWSSWVGLEEPRRCGVKIRYRSPEAPATLYPLPDGSVRVVPDEPVRAVAPGQSAVFYDGDAVAGGGILQRPASKQIHPP